MTYRHPPVSRFIPLPAQNAARPMLSGNPYSRHFAAQDLCSPTPLVLHGCPYLSARTSALPLSISARVDAPVFESCRSKTFLPQATVSRPALIAPLRFADSSGLDRNTGIAPRPTQLAFFDSLSRAAAQSPDHLSPRHRRLSAKSSARPVSRPGAHTRVISGCVSTLNCPPA